MQRCCIKAVITSSLILIGLELAVLAGLIYCHVASRPWEHKMPMFSCLLVRMGRGSNGKIWKCPFWRGYT